MTEGRRRALALLAGIGVALGQVPFSLVPLALAALGLAGWLAMRSSTAWRAAWIGLAAGTGYFGTTLHWIVAPFLVEPEVYGWMAPFAFVFTAVGFGLFWMLAFGVARRVAANGWRFALAFAGALAGAEALRALILTGFPWVLLGTVWSEGPGAQLGAFVGPFGLTLLVAGIGGGLAALGPRPVSLAGLVLAWTVPIGLGALRPPAPPVADDAATVRLVQPNAPQDEKWDPVLSQEFFQRALEFTAAGAVPDLVIWPETSVPFLIETGQGPAIDRMAMAARGARLVFGAQRLGDGWRYFNSALVLGPDGQIADSYDKYHLVPFGEYVPFGDFAARFGIRGLAASQGFGYSAGPGLRTIDLGPLGNPLPLICYEAIFPEEVGAVSPRPDWLMQITNDAWFGTFAGPQQHLAITRMRAIEQGLPMMRAANTGISAAIDAGGRVLASIPLGEAGYLDVPLPPARSPTLYARTGDWPAWGAMLLSLLAARWLRPKRLEAGGRPR
ncbi:apolipoprotein N-acyltransferase [Palleronia rufa]|uniref:apolipoprotein N-acyltransferase n=1 Tax=Palleronia rufa TaxID=1530186 RepID=UPI00055BB910|nr:apolipoprotein N-acyltransferase [Palleronia rufa]